MVCTFIERYPKTSKLQGQGSGQFVKSLTTRPSLEMKYQRRSGIMLSVMKIVMDLVKSHTIEFGVLFHKSNFQEWIVPDLLTVFLLRS